MDKPQANTNSQDSSWLRFGGTHHLPSYNILCAWPRDQHSNVILSQDSQMEIPKFPKLKLSPLWTRITLFAYLRLRWNLKQSCSPHWDLFNNMWHTTWTQGDWGDSWLLVIRSQIDNLIPNPSFNHNLCFKNPNGSCKPILDMCILRTFQWYNEHLNSMGLNDPFNQILKIWESIKTPTPKVGTHLGVWGSFLHTLLHSWEHEMWFPGFFLGMHPYKPLPWLWAQG
jgi:hypothetical protein